MRNALFAALAAAALLCSRPVQAQTQTIYFTYPQAGTGTLTTSGDVVAIDIKGWMWATVQWSVIGTAGTAAVLTEYSNDGGTNWLIAPYSKRLSTVTANPFVANLGFAPPGSALVTGNVWETPLPGNVTNFRLRCGGTGTTTSVQVNGGTPYVPTVPVIATMYDVSVTAGASNNTPTLDTSGWREAIVTVVQTTAATGAASLNIVDDGGSAVALGTSASIAVGNYSFGWGEAGSFGTANPFTMVGGVTSLPLDRRFNIAVAGATTSATRIRVVARR